MIRTTCEAALFGLWRDSAMLEALVVTEHLTTARYEPVSRSALGSGYVDLLFETTEQSCVIGAIRLDPNSLITRERSPFIWPAYLASVLDASRLLSVERLLTPWLRACARARPMARESIRRFTASERFDRARAAELLGAAPLAPVMRRMAPFVYARRFAVGSRVSIDCADAALAHALLRDLAASIADRRGPAGDPRGDRAFARAWYGVDVREFAAAGASDLMLVDRHESEHAPIVVETSASFDARGASIDVPSPAPLDLLFSFDVADAPAMSRFSVHAVEPPLRACAQSDPLKAFGGSAGAIVLAMSAEAVAMRGLDLDEAETLAQCLSQEGFTASIVTDVRDAMMAGAQLVHVFGAPFEAHTIAFAQTAQERGIDFVCDVPPRPQSPSGYVENMLMLALRAASDDAERARYLQAYEMRGVTGTTAPEPSAQEYAHMEARFAELTPGAIAVLADEEDVESLRAWLPPSVASRVLARGVFAAPESAPAPVGHLVPSLPFAFIHATICARSHALFAAVAAQSRDVPLVIAGPCYDVEYLQTLRTIAPGAVVLADPGAEIVSAIYRRATLWIDAAPRPRSAAGLVRAAACGALPVLAAESPLARIAGPGAPTFTLSSFESSAATLVEAMALIDRGDRIAALQSRLAPRRDIKLSFGRLMAAYARVATTV